MKKIFGILMVIALALTSCENDDFPNNTGQETTDVLLKKMVVTDASGLSVTSQYSYDGNRITGIVHSNGITESYSYSSNGALTEIRFYEAGNLVKKSVFEYATSGSFAAVVHLYYDIANPANNHAERFNYTLAGEDIAVTKYTGDEQSQTTEDETYTLKVISNNITLITGDIEADYDFDYQPSPLSNVANYGILYLAGLQGGINNIVWSEVNGVVTDTSYLYNPSGFPTQVEVTTGGETHTITYTY